MSPHEDEWQNATPDSNESLVERTISFDRDYWMRCEKCEGRSHLSAQDYSDEINGARIPCEHCGSPIHFGRAVAALRDLSDPALDDHLVHQLAWYHTSTDPKWPAADYAARFEAELDWTVRGFGPTLEQYVHTEVTKALHVGTYEAAVENMLRRMRNEHDGLSQFYLYRVRLRPTLALATGYRDENREASSKLSVGALELEGIDALRYLNAHEDVGSVSMAIRPSALASIQRIAIPLEADFEDNMAEPELLRYQAALQALEPAESLLGGVSALERLIRSSGRSEDPNGLARKHHELELESYRARDELEERLANLCLGGVSGPVRRDFAGALAHSGLTTRGLEVYRDRFIRYARLLTDPGAVLRCLDSKSWRLLQST